MIISLIKSKFLFEQFQKIYIYIYNMGAFQHWYFGNWNPRIFKLCIKI